MATVGRPMASGAGGGIPGNDLGHGSTSPSTFTHVLGVSGAPIGAVGGAADGRRNMGKTSCMHQRRVPHAGFCGGRTQHHPLSAPSAEIRAGERVCGAYTTSGGVKVNDSSGLWSMVTCHLGLL